MQTNTQKRMGTMAGLGPYVRAVGPRLPRIAAVTILVMGLAFVGVHFQPARYQASLDLPFAAEIPADQQIADLLDPVRLADIVARLPQSVVQELRATDELLDSITLLRRTLTIAPTADGENLRVVAIARTEANARAIGAAIAASHALDQTIIAAPPVAVSQASAAPAPAVAPRSPLGDADLGVLQQRMTLAWENRVTLEEKAKRIDTLVASGDFAALALHADGLPGLSRRLDDLLTLQAEEKRLALTLLPNHPNMRAVSEQIALANAEIGDQARQLAELMRADSEAARKLEATLRGEYEAQLASRTAAIEDTILTGSVESDTGPRVSAMPRPIGTSLALGLAGGAALFGQLGLIALQQPREPKPPRPARTPRARREKKSAEPVASPAADLPEAAPPLMAAPEVAPAPVPAPQAEAPIARPAELPPTAPQPLAAIAPEPIRALPISDHNWFAGSLDEPQIPIAANWIGTPAAEAPRAATAAPAPEPGNDEAGLSDARIVAIRSRGTPGDTRAKARELLDMFADEGKRVVLIDAASRRRGNAPGISDLSMGMAGFADIIHGTGAEVAALIPWGRQDTLYPSAQKVRTLLLALVELYDVVVITLDAEAGGSSHLAAMADVTLTATPTAQAPRRKQRVAHWQ
ncbi:hypothetical protein [Devosia sp. SD17-2]|uniref:hypothetical protein n=1 Tax=Devosia sp. SD17-2 TaxID=2976459 RepID=UPI0023D8AF96|nr:hypothetical protein [Devosia sp. SD17-2]